MHEPLLTASASSTHVTNIKSKQVIN